MHYCLIASKDFLEEEEEETETEEQEDEFMSLNPPRLKNFGKNKNLLKDKTSILKKKKQEIDDNDLGDEYRPLKRGVSRTEARKRSNHF